MLLFCAVGPERNTWLRCLTPMHPCFAGSDAFLLEALFRNNVWEFMLLPVSEENERAVCLSMIDGCK
jgi:[ribulose-bisphosphate carboxylase]-lysine N-methyltransferase